MYVYMCVCWVLAVVLCTVAVHARRGQNIVNRLSKDIETDLRLHIHSHLKLDDRNPFRVGLKDRSPFLRTQPLRYFGRTLAIKGTAQAQTRQPHSACLD
jgi:hypothetical protein